eukprot:CAMPEP_0175927648 /NCGR_PEP_ID=MMETSP0108-20121206/16834_1 /TAXON_ID=195067 ORGANISM="Goniomonas pacifica, Strain CCMP1869" /NCGR_SAMPLE_ID=MMETSP0108 /ASSEMBLY_ACC=CAM_ASM_000204 /LENGTH=158 /DNA_ID=CAMNT_0017250965 /DNA_START=347 /DNA_END=823 /DNA_ORIENTATION=-
MDVRIFNPIFAWHCFRDGVQGWVHRRVLVLFLSHVVQHALRQHGEDFLHSSPVLGRCFKVGEPTLPLLGAPVHCCLPVQPTQICLVAHYAKRKAPVQNVIASLNRELFDPTLSALQWGFIVHITNDEARVRSTVERHTKALESFLTGSVPDLGQISRN